ncbi:hypothetical protein BKA66DRAFT_206508 [Pyrenochaeta sp. MPI-SDFR-AT-0127]|nr:hypothetical protein BKA66DRAFT_206508 [Pyrenochaeta sp. MPI-SDFR-AT-0127]
MDHVDHHAHSQHEGPGQLPNCLAKIHGSQQGSPVASSPMANETTHSETASFKDGPDTTITDTVTSDPQLIIAPHAGAGGSSAAIEVPGTARDPTRTTCMDESIVPEAPSEDDSENAPLSRNSATQSRIALSPNRYCSPRRLRNNLEVIKDCKPHRTLAFREHLPGQTFDRSLCRSGEHVVFLTRRQSRSFKEDWVSAYRIGLGKEGSKPRPELRFRICLPVGYEWSQVSIAGEYLVVWGQQVAKFYNIATRKSRRLHDSAQSESRGILKSVAVSTRGSVALLFMHKVYYIDAACDGSELAVVHPRTRADPYGWTISSIAFDNVGRHLYIAEKKANDRLRIGVWQLIKNGNSHVCELVHTSKVIHPSELGPQYPRNIQPFSKRIGCTFQTSQAEYMVWDQEFERVSEPTPKTSQFGASCLYKDAAFFFVDGESHQKPTIKRCDIEHELQRLAKGTLFGKLLRKDHLVKLDLDASDITAMSVVPFPKSGNMTILICTKNDEVLTIHAVCEDPSERQ